MVSNDDIDFSTKQVNLQPIISASSNSTQWTHESTVPSGKRWRFIGAYMEQIGSYWMSVNLKDPAITQLEMFRIQAVRTFWQPTVDMSLPEGWKIRLWFEYISPARWMYAKIFIEEETLY